MTDEDGRIAFSEDLSGFSERGEGKIEDETEGDNGGERWVVTNQTFSFAHSY